jgi:hypothetical protein
MNDLTAVVKLLELERNRLSAQLERLNDAVSVLHRIGGNPAGRSLSAAGRARIAAAQRARWAKWRKAPPNT